MCLADVQKGCCAPRCNVNGPTCAGSMPQNGLRVSSRAQVNFTIRRRPSRFAICNSGQMLRRSHAPSVGLPDGTDGYRLVVTGRRPGAMGGSADNPAV